MATKEFWAKRLTVSKLERPWWPTQHVKALATIEVAGALKLVAHVVDGRGGAFVSPPSSKRGTSFEPTWELVDEGLREAIAEATLVAYAEWAPVGVGAAR